MANALTFAATGTARWLMALCIALTALCDCRAQTPHRPALKTTMLEDAFADDGMSFRVLCYHDARDNLRASLKDWPEAAALDTRAIIDQFEWLSHNGYHVVSLDAVLAARNGGPKLPARAVVLSFDDGYLSMYTRIFPLLKLFNYPAVIGLVGEWLEDGVNGQVFYGDRWMARSNFLSWEQIREMAASGLVEVASHSYGLHKGVRGNPQGAMTASATTRTYDPVTGSYEDDAQYLGRIRADLARNSALIEQHTGKKPRVMIWPYGAYNMTGVRAAQAEGMPITMSLDAGPNTPDHPLARVRREILVFDDRIGDLKRNLTQQAKYDGVEDPLERVVVVDLDSVYDQDPILQEKKVGDLVERILRLRVNTVYLRAVADADGDGLAEAAYFPNRHLPLRADLFHRVAWQLRTRAAVAPDFVDVYAWLPMQAFKLPPGVAPVEAHFLSGRDAPKPDRPSALSARVREAIDEIYQDLGKNAPRVAGLMIGPDGLATDSTQSMIAAFKDGQPNAITVRMLDPASMLDPQSYSDALKQYDYVAVMMKLTDAGAVWTHPPLHTLVNAARQVPGALQQTVFLLDSTSAREPTASNAFANAVRLLQDFGARNFGYRSADLSINHPSLKTIRAALSLETHPESKP